VETGTPVVRLALGPVPLLLEVWTSLVTPPDLVELKAGV